MSVSVTGSRAWPSMYAIARRTAAGATPPSLGVYSLVMVMFGKTASAVAAIRSTSWRTISGLSEPGVEARRARWTKPASNLHRADALSLMGSTPSNRSCEGATPEYSSARRSTSAIGTRSRVVSRPSMSTVRA